MEDEIYKKDLVKWAVVVMFLLAIGMTAIYISGLKNRLDLLERKQAEQETIQQTKIDDLAVNIDGVREEMRTGFDEQQKQIDSQAEQISKVKQVQRNTNSAFTRYQKQRQQVEDEIREELKKD